MRFKENLPPREFEVGSDKKCIIKDCGTMQLAPDEQVTFITPDGGEYDVTRKFWGFYATPSMNARLADHGLRAGLVINSIGRLYLMLVEIGKEKEFFEYLKRDNQKLLSWLCTDADVERIKRMLAGTEMTASGQIIRKDDRRPNPGDKPTVFRYCPMCSGADMYVHFVYPEPPTGELHYKFTDGVNYWRELHSCRQCGHYLEYHRMDQNTFYTNDYVDTTYGDQGKVKAAFQKIISLPVDESDNEGRVQRILEFAKGYFPRTHFTSNSPRLLDVGSGLCVFGWRMKKEGWDVTALDMDVRLVDHARNTVGVNALLEDVRCVGGIGAFDVITFNKVLEHVEDPISMLSSVSRLLSEDGFIYMELPDGENAQIEGQDREEYLLGHIHVFSPTSMTHLIRRAGFNLITMERLREPSTKFTLRAFVNIFTDHMRTARRLHTVI